jgi:transcriptional regulator with XRE-family HTH domain
MGNPAMNPSKIIERIKELRMQRDWSLDTLARKADLSKGYLSKIENGMNLPPISTLHKIAEALGVDLTYLFAEGESDGSDHKISITRRRERKEMTIEVGKVLFKNWPLSPEKEGRNMDPFLVEIPFKNPHVYQHEGEEFYFLLEGKIKLSYSGQDYILEKGDSVYFDTNVPHTGYSIGRRKAVALVIFYNYKKAIRKPFTGAVMRLGPK